MAIDTNIINIIEEPSIILSIDENDGSVIELNTTEDSVEILEIAIQGLSGSDGESDKFYEHNQIAASNTWVINHNLNKYPSVTIVDSGETKVEGDVEYNSINQVTLTFSSVFSGKAYFN